MNPAPGEPVRWLIGYKGKVDDHPHMAYATKEEAESTPSPDSCWTYHPLYAAPVEDAAQEADARRWRWFLNHAVNGTVKVGDEVLDVAYHFERDIDSQIAASPPPAQPQGSDVYRPGEAIAAGLTPEDREVLRTLLGGERFKPALPEPLSPIEEMQAVLQTMSRLMDEAETAIADGDDVMHLDLQCDRIGGKYQITLIFDAEGFV